MLYTLVCGMWPMVYIPHTTYHVPHATCHIPHATCHIPHTTYHIPHTTYHIPHTKYHIPRCIALNIHGKTEHVQPAVLLANSLEYPERIQRGLEWTQFLKRLLACSLSVCLLANFLFFC